MKAAFSQASLALTVNTLPSVERRQLCYLPPRRSDAEEDLYTDIFSQSQGEERFQIQPNMQIFFLHSCIAALGRTFTVPFGKLKSLTWKIQFS